MIITKTDLTSIHTRIKALHSQSSNPSFFSYLWRPNPIKELKKISLELKNKVSLALNEAGQTQDQKIKYAVCKQLLDLSRTLYEESERGFLKKMLKQHHSPALLQGPLSEMKATLNNALIRGNDRQQIWGTRFCYEEAFSDQQWEESMAMNLHLPQNPVGLFKYYVLFSLSLLWVQLVAMFTSQHWRDKITTTGPHQAGLYLGGLPLSAPFHNDLKALKKEGIGAVLSMVEPFENHSKGWISSPITLSQWKEAGVKQLQIPMEDFGTGPIPDVEKGVEFIRWNVLNNRSVYVHCKAGRGRSALVVMAYLIKYENLSAKQALALVQSQRYQVNWRKTDPKMQTLLEYEARVRTSQENINRLL